MALAVLASCSGDARPKAGGSSTPGPITVVAPTSSTVAIATTPSTVPVAPSAVPAPPRDGAPHFAVGTIVRDFTDTNRGRTLHTIIHFPARGAPGGTGTDPADGAFPLVLMAHGYRLPAAGYERILGMVSAAGYIVVAPAFPHTSAERGDGDRRDIVNQPADLSFLIDAVADLTKQQPPPLPAIADTSRVAALGHSDGGLTVTAWGYNDSYRDSRVAAVVSMTGGIGLFPGTYFASASPPLLAIHATADETNPYSASVSLFNAVPPGTPRFLLTIDGGSHLGPYMFDTASADVGRVIVDFLDGYLLEDSGSRQRLLVDGDRPGTMTLRSG